VTVCLDFYIFSTNHNYYGRVEVRGHVTTRPKGEEGKRKKKGGGVEAVAENPIFSGPREVGPARAECSTERKGREREKKKERILSRSLPPALSLSLKPASPREEEKEKKRGDRDGSDMKLKGTVSPPIRVSPKKERGKRKGRKKDENTRCSRPASLL